jgi:hypothetical protein
MKFFARMNGTQLTLVWVAVTDQAGWRDVSETRHRAGGAIRGGFAARARLPHDDPARIKIGELSMRMADTVSECH